MLPLGVAETPDLVQILLNRDLALLQEKKYHEVQEHLAPLYRMHALTISLSYSKAKQPKNTVPSSPWVHSLPLCLTTIFYFL